MIRPSKHSCVSAIVCDPCNIRGLWDALFGRKIVERIRDGIAACDWCMICAGVDRLRAIYLTSFEFLIRDRVYHSSRGPGLRGQVGGGESEFPVPRNRDGFSHVSGNLYCNNSLFLATFLLTL